MRLPLLWAALTAISLTGGTARADDNTPAQLQLNVRVLTGDPLGSVEAGTLKMLCDTRLVTLTKRPALIVSGGELPVMRDGKKIDYITIGHKAEFFPNAVQDGKVHLDINLENTTVVANTKERIELRSDSTRMHTAVKFGDTVKLRWPGGKADDQTWAELTINMVQPVGHSKVGGQNRAYKAEVD
jgi:hypothetical protein